jgi:transposase-like protein
MFSVSGLVERLRLFERNRRLIAVDETCVNVNGEQYWVYLALDIDGNELISMRVYPTTNSLTSEFFFNGVLKYCEGKLEFIVDNAPWLKDTLTDLD